MLVRFELSPGARYNKAMFITYNITPARMKHIWLFESTISSRPLCICEVSFGRSSSPLFTSLHITGNADGCIVKGMVNSEMFAYPDYYDNEHTTITNKIIFHSPFIQSFIISQLCQEVSIVAQIRTLKTLLVKQAELPRGVGYNTNFPSVVICWSMIVMEILVWCYLKYLNHNSTESNLCAKVSTNAADYMTLIVKTETRTAIPWVILSMGSANERRYCNI